MSKCYLLISNNNKNKYFNSKLIFDKLDDNHLLRLFMLQKIKKNANINDKIIIYLDDNIEINDFKINNKLKSMLKYQSSIYHIYLEEYNEDKIDINDIKRYNEVINKKK
jgi:hypothetical protein